MAPLTQPVIDLMGMTAAVLGITWLAVTIPTLLMRQLGWFGYAPELPGGD